MDDVREKLSRCFAMEFPKLDPDLYSTASAHTVSGWDSIALAAALQDQNSAAPESKKNTSSSDN
jgi:hypothetical protein